MTEGAPNPNIPSLPELPPGITLEHRVINPNELLTIIENGGFNRDNELARPFIELYDLATERIEHWEESMQEKLSQLDEPNTTNLAASEIKKASEQINGENTRIGVTIVKENGIPIGVCQYVFDDQKRDIRYTTPFTLVGVATEKNEHRDIILKHMFDKSIKSLIELYKKADGQPDMMITFDEETGGEGITDNLILVLNNYVQIGAIEESEDSAFEEAVLPDQIKLVHISAGSKILIGKFRGKKIENGSYQAFQGTAEYTNKEEGSEEVTPITFEQLKELFPSIEGEDPLKPDKIEQFGPNVFALSWNTPGNIDRNLKVEEEIQEFLDKRTDAGINPDFDDPSNYSIRFAKAFRLTE